jgi:hypothetical protein
MLSLFIGMCTFIILAVLQNWIFSHMPKQTLEVLWMQNHVSISRRLDYLLRIFSINPE